MSIKDYIIRVIMKRIFEREFKKFTEVRMESKTKKWHESKTIRAGIAVGAINLYTLVQWLGSSYFGFALPSIPEWVITSLSTLLGGIAIQGRIGASTKIGS